ncbi:glycosyltransferase family 4 protein [Desulfovibrio sp. OttesenSCG-928-A18]|nr:glycosyltransferase family 4 protein [Desulfovibrio sp. OttesenSCG-928-A18]
MKNWSQRHNNTRVFLSLHGSFPHQTSGYGVRSHAIASHLLHHGVDLAVYTRPGFPWVTRALKDKAPDMCDRVDNVEYRRIPAPWPPILPVGNNMELLATQLAIYIQNSGARLVHAASNFENGMPAIMGGRTLRCKTIYEYRGMWHYTRASYMPWHDETRDYQNCHQLEIQTGQMADAVFAISEALKQDLVDNGIAGDKITVIPNAADSERFSPLPPDTALKASLGLEGRKVVGFIGSVTPYEGLESLIDAVISLNTRGEKVSLLIVGNGLHDEGLQKFYALRGRHKSIVFAGRVPYAEVDRYYSIIDIMPFPRINAKVCQCVPPLKPLEAMIMRKVVLVSDVAALTEIVSHNRTGLVCKADDSEDLMEALGRLLHSPDLCRELVQNAEDWVHAERTWHKVCPRILDVYEELIAN